MFTVLIFILLLMVLVLVHEAGHFFAARSAGVKVEEFGFGFPPRLIGWWRHPITKKFHFVFGKQDIASAQATVYSLNLLPLGGFVKIKGETGEFRNDTDSFGHQKTWRRALILIAGVAMNFILAAVLLGVGFVKGLPGIIGEQGTKGTITNRQVAVAEVFSDTPASEAGIMVGDMLIAIPDVSYPTVAQIQKYMQTHVGETVSIVVSRQGKEIPYQITPRVLEASKQGGVGVGLLETALISYPWYVAFPKGFIAAGSLTLEIFKTFGELIRNLVLGRGVSMDISGPVGIAVLTGQVARMGFIYIVQFAALLSLNLAIINVLPFPALDGGRLLFLCIEKIRGGRRVAERIEHMAHTIGFVLLMLLIVVVTYRDIARFSGSFKNFFGNIL